MLKKEAPVSKKKKKSELIPFWLAMHVYPPKQVFIRRVNKGLVLDDSFSTKPRLVAQFKPAFVDTGKTPEIIVIDEVY